MPDETPDELKDMLEAGWEIAGYTVNMTAMGSQHYNILLRKGGELVNFGILWDQGREAGRAKTVLSPVSDQPPAKKGFWG